MQRNSMFIDENLASRQIGGWVISDCHRVVESIHALKQRFGYYDEIKYSEISKYNVKFCMELLLLLKNVDFTFYVMQFPSIKIFSYVDFVAKVIDGYDNMFVFLDYFNNSGGLYVEDLLYEKSDKIMYALRQDSKSNVLIQVTDLLLGLYTRDLSKITSPHKKEVIVYMQSLDLIKKCIFLDNKKTGYSL